MGRLLALFTLLTTATYAPGCASTMPTRPTRDSHADDGWSEHVGVLILRIRSPHEYLVIPNAYPFHLHIDLLETETAGWQHRAPFSTIQNGTGGETVWDGALHLAVFLNTARFVRHGYLAIRPTGLTRVPNPLRLRCPRSLVDAAVADMRGQHLLILETRVVGRVEHHGCVYRFRYLIE